MTTKDKARLSNRANAIWHLALRRDKDSAPAKSSLEAVLGALAAKQGVEHALNTHHDDVLGGTNGTQEKAEAETWDIDIDLPPDWNVGLIVGPSGAGKTTIAQELFGEHIVAQWDWDNDKSLVDSFPSDMGIKEIVGLNSVGFSSPPVGSNPLRH